MDRAIPDPTWKRLGFAEQPDFHTSGLGVGIVIIDSIKQHHLVNHLNTRIKCVAVHENMTISVRDISSMNREEDNRKGDKVHQGKERVMNDRPFHDQRSLLLLDIVLEA